MPTNVTHSLDTDAEVCSRPNHLTKDYSLGLHLGFYFCLSIRLYLTLCRSYLKPYCMGRKTAFFSVGILMYRTAIAL
jgi:hypothetical protein